jgi:hypothetical protein
MPTIVLRDSDNKDAGFLLVAGDQPLAASQSRDVVLMALPIPNESALASFVREHKHIEFQAHTSASGEQLLVSFPVPPDSNVDIKVGLDSAGSWSVAGVGTGSCHVLPAKA